MSKILNICNTLRDLLLDPTTSLEHYLQALRSWGYWPVSVNSLQTVTEARQVAIRMLIILIGKLDLPPSNFLDNEKAPDVEDLRPSLDHIVNGWPMSKKLRFCFHEIYPNTNIPRPQRRRRLILHTAKIRDVFKIPYDIDTIEHLAQWIKTSNEIPQVGPATDICLTDENGGELQGQLTEMFIVCRLSAELDLQAAEELVTAVMTAWATVVRTFSFCVNSLLRILGKKPATKVD